MVAIGFGVLLIGAIKGYEQYLIVKFWPAAKGQVTNSQVTSVNDAGSATRYQPQVEFRYRVGGMEYVSKTITNSDAVDYPEAKRIANSYAPGSWHVVRYDPTDPADIRANAGYTLDFLSSSYAGPSCGRHWSGTASSYPPGREARCQKPPAKRRYPRISAAGQTTWHQDCWPGRAPRDIASPSQ
jgi:hypothetical protein